MYNVCINIMCTCTMYVLIIILQRVVYVNTHFLFVNCSSVLENEAKWSIHHN